MSNWKVTDYPLWHSESRIHFPFIFRVSKSKAGYDNRATVELYSDHAPSNLSGDAQMDALKEYFDNYIAKEEEKEKRIADLEQKIKKLEEALKASAPDYQI